MAGKGAPTKNQYAKKQGKGVAISIYVSQKDIGYIQQLLSKQGKSVDDWREAARTYASKGIQREIKPLKDVDLT